MVEHERTKLGGGAGYGRRATNGELVNARSLGEQKKRTGHFKIVVYSVYELYARSTNQRGTTHDLQRGVSTNALSTSQLSFTHFNQQPTL